MSHIERIYDHLKRMGSITVKQAFNLYGICHLPAVIRDIKKKYNVNIYGERATGLNRFKEKIYWKVYKIEKPKTS